jgi:hypothetical protein
VEKVFFGGYRDGVDHAFEIGQDFLKKAHLQCW